MGELGLLGGPIPEEYGGAGLDYISFGLICEEIERAETAFRVLQSVHVGLNSLSLLQWGNEEQKQKYLVPQARGEKLATFGLTEPGCGSDVGNIQTTAVRKRRHLRAQRQPRSGSRWPTWPTISWSSPAPTRARSTTA